MQLLKLLSFSFSPNGPNVIRIRRLFNIVISTVARDTFCIVHTKNWWTRLDCRQLSSGCDRALSSQLESANRLSEGFSRYSHSDTFVADRRFRSSATTQLGSFPIKMNPGFTYSASSRSNLSVVSPKEHFLKRSQQRLFHPTAHHFLLVPQHFIFSL